MMDFIVLGLVPGTQIQITFFGTVLISAVVMFTLVYATVKLQQRQRLNQRRSFDIISLRNLERA